jgi:hypothetical protein
MFFNVIRHITLNLFTTDEHEELSSYFVQIINIFADVFILI